MRRKIKDNFIEGDKIPHPKIPFVYQIKNKYFCETHFNPRGMNKGAMRQHIQGKLHRKDFDTGKDLVETAPPFESLPQEMYWPDKEQTLKFNPKIFWQLKPILESFMQNDPRTVNEILLDHAFDFSLKWDIIPKLNDYYSSQDRRVDMMIETDMRLLGIL